jgi:hypothetical protein
VALVLDLRRRFRMTAAMIARHLDLAHATVARWLARRGLGRLAALDAPPPFSTGRSPGSPHAA